MTRTMLLITVLLLTPMAEAMDAPDFRLGRLVTSGSGCPSEATRVDLRQNGVIDLTFGRNAAQVGEGIPSEDAIRRCDVTLTLEHEAGWSFAVRNYEVFGLADLTEGLTASVNLWHGNDSRRPLKVSEVMVGPLANYDYHLRASQDRDRIVWSDCVGGQSIKLAMALELSPVKGQTGFLGQCACGNPDIRLDLVWRRCR